MQFLSVTATALMFLGGVLLSIDSLLARRRRRVTEGANELVKLAQGTLTDEEGRPLEDHEVLDEWIHSGMYSRAKWGFAITTIGFLLELISKVGAL